ncbi:MAG: HTH domain-containing protein [Muribaculaceae bacterium]|nr:HTH domain-containing protein [Muribaculaceae bacterium]
MEYSKRSKNNPAISASILSKLLGFNHRTIQRDLKHMQELGIIVHEGSDRGGIWKRNIIENEGKK